MTTHQLTMKLNMEFGKDNPWPDTYVVDAHTYANVCQAWFDLASEILGVRVVALGPNKGILFKNVELILGENENETYRNVDASHSHV